ncbi:preprotein translocase subunit SecE [Ligilactobacillus cholophilus]|uniref:preprotein translocase subunit SecE n=1 Tax=Ligilactobacillus cholophilus TaxID=3050131 RepID=UPI0025B24517|nr:preprotein translocase subunit SecE [Ligilactobacillus cholophilus]
MRFIKEVIQTMKDTTWETAKETRKDTSTVVVMSLALVAFFAIVDACIQGLIALI